MINQCLVVVLLFTALLSCHPVAADVASDDTLTFLDVDTLFIPAGTDGARQIISDQMARLRDLITNSLNSANDNDEIIIDRVVDVTCAGDMLDDDGEALVQAMHEAAVAEAAAYVASLPDSDTTTTTVTTYAFMTTTNNNRTLLFGALVCWAIIGLVSIIWIVVNAMKGEAEEETCNPSISIPAPVLQIHVSSDQLTSSEQLRQPLLNDTTVIV
jgi:hypothetical protein